ncbi:MAG TPA: protease modulator HflC [Burkholderiales bacterium]|nr:protease modulator HflC [Burkholderiales bacterium]
MNPRIGIGLAVVVGAVLLLSMSAFTVDQRQRALVFQLGEIKDLIEEPGLHFKWPLIQNVRYFDTRILTWDDPEAQRFITAENKPVQVDAFVKWRIVDVKKYYVSVAGDEIAAARRINQTVNGLLREEFGKRTVHDVVSGERDDIMNNVREKVDLDVRSLGIRVVDVRLKRVDLPQEVSVDVYRRMESERKRVASELRSNGFAEAEKIRADADKQREVIIAQAYRDAQRTQGEGDARAAAIYARAFNENPEFYAFYRSLEAYRTGFKNKSDVLVLDPNSEFFRYFRNLRKGGK